LSLAASATAGADCTPASVVVVPFPTYGRKIPPVTDAADAEVPTVPSIPAILCVPKIRFEACEDRSDELALTARFHVPTSPTRPDAPEDVIYGVKYPPYRKRADAPLAPELEPRGDAKNPASVVDADPSIARFWF
jgi:hypothetical protein